MGGTVGQSIPTQVAQPQAAMGTPIVTGNTYNGSNMQNNSGSKGTGQPSQTAMGTPIVTGNTYLPQSSMAKNQAPLSSQFSMGDTTFSNQGY